LATGAIAARELLWAWKPKLHYFEHLLDVVVSERLNLCYLWNFAEEDLIGVSIDIAGVTHRLSVPERTLDRYYIRIALAFAKRDVVATGPPAWLRP